MAEKCETARRYCPECHAEIAEATWPFCQACDAELIYCPHCWQPLSIDAEACPYCGADLEAGS